MPLIQRILMTLPAELQAIDLDMLAYDIADAMDKGEYGLGEVSQDDLRPFLVELLMKALEHARTSHEAPADPPRNTAGDLVHTCNGDNRCGLPFGRKAPRGICARCDELADGADPSVTASTPSPTLSPSDRPGWMQPRPDETDCLSPLRHVGHLTTDARLRLLAF